MNTQRSLGGERVKCESLSLLSLLRSEKLQAGVFSVTEKRRCRLLSPFHHLTSESAILRSPEDTLPTVDLKAYARRGAEGRVAELRAPIEIE